MASHVIARIANDAQKARSMEPLAQRLAESIVTAESEGPEAQSRESIPLFVMTALNGASSAPKTRLNRKAILAARKNPIP